VILLCIFHFCGKQTTLTGKKRNVHCKRVLIFETNDSTQNFCYDIKRILAESAAAHSIVAKWHAEFT